MDNLNLRNKYDVIPLKRRMVSVAMVEYRMGQAQCQWFLFNLIWDLEGSAVGLYGFGSQFCCFLVI